MNLNFILFFSFLFIVCTNSFDYYTSPVSGDEWGVGRECVLWSIGEDYGYLILSVCDEVLSICELVNDDGGYCFYVGDYVPYFPQVTGYYKINMTRKTSPYTKWYSDDDSSPEVNFPYWAYLPLFGMVIGCTILIVWSCYKRSRSIATNSWTSSKDVNRGLAMYPGQPHPSPVIVQSPVMAQQPSVMYSQPPVMVQQPVLDQQQPYNPPSDYNLPSSYGYGGDFSSLPVSYGYNSSSNDASAPPSYYD